MNGRGVLTRARELITTHGWIQFDFGSDERGYCLFGALSHSAFLLREESAPGTYPSSNVFEAAQLEREAMLILRSILGGSVITWNDAPGRTKEEVLTLLEEVLTIPPQIDFDIEQLS